MDPWHRHSDLATNPHAGTDRGSVEQIERLARSWRHWAACPVMVGGAVACPTAISELCVKGTVGQLAIAASAVGRALALLSILPSLLSILYSRPPCPFSQPML